MSGEPQNAPHSGSGVTTPRPRPSGATARLCKRSACAPENGPEVQLGSATPSAFQTLAAKLDGDKAPAVDCPKRSSFEEFLLLDARVPDATRPGEYSPYSFEGREAVRLLVRRIDAVLGSNTGKPIADARCGVAGGAQWGKTILELNFAGYATAQAFLRFGMFLPDEALAAGMVDTKLRPDVIDQIPWLAEMTQVGKAVNKSGKAVNRRGAFMVTDGQRRSYGLVLGLQKIPTSYTLDIAAKDEVDDIPEKTGKFVRGRLTSSPLRFSLDIGTQRVAGRGMNKVWKDGSQGVILLGPSVDVHAWTKRDENGEVDSIPEGWINPEENFPQIVRRQLGEAPSVIDPKLTWSGAFKRDGDEATTWSYVRGATYYLAHPETGFPLNRRQPLGYHRVPAKLQSENWTLRISQYSIDALSVAQLVHGFCDEDEGAISSPDAMIVYRCDVLALPQSSAQALTPAIISRAQDIDPFRIRLTREAGRPAFGGLDMGDQCWFLVRERESGARKRLTYAGKIPAADIIGRAVSLFQTIGLDALFIDQRPLVSQSRSIALELNGLSSLTRWPDIPKAGNREAFISLPGGLTWDGGAQRWRNLKCAVVRFDKKKLGAGIEHGFDEFDEGGMTKFVPLINVNRFETIDRAVREFLTPAESVVEVIAGAIRETPALLLPMAGCDPIVATIEAHLVTGSEREKEKDGSLGDYVDACQNHLLLSDGYSILAEMECGNSRRALPFVARGVRRNRRDMAERPSRRLNS
jgi:hypothetical protein